jgi:hypothetical protein
MSTVKICDRCGKKLEREMPKVRLRTFRYILDIETSYERQEFDLCEECFDEFMLFLNSKEKQDDQ